MFCLTARVPDVLGGCLVLQRVFVASCIPFTIILSARGWNSHLGFFFFNLHRCFFLSQYKPGQSACFLEKLVGYDFFHLSRICLWHWRAGEGSRGALLKPGLNYTYAIHLHIAWDCISAFKRALIGTICFDFTQGLSANNCPWWWASFNKL